MSGTESGEQLSKHDAFAAVRDSNYRLYALAFACSSFALQMSGMALKWEIYERTGNPFLLGLMGVARALPVVLMALPAGQLVDWFRRQKVMMLTQAGFGVVMAAIAVAVCGVGGMRGTVWAILGLVSCLGMVRTFNGPARNSLLPDLVAVEIFPNAVTWNIGIFQASAICGPLLAGWMIDKAKHSWGVFAVCSVLCLISSALASRLKPLREPVVEHGSISLRGLWRGMGDGVSHVWRDKLILSTITLDLFAVLLGGATGLLPVYAKDILDVGAVGLGWLTAAPFLGALGTSALLAARPIQRNCGKLLLSCVGIFGVCMIVFGFSTWFWLSMAALVIAGGVDGVSVVIRHVLVQMRTPASLRGRVSSVNSVFIECSNELGSFESGAVAKAVGSSWGSTVGAVASVVSGGIGTLLVVIVVGLTWRELWRLDRLK